jgi:glucokinase
MIHKGSVTPSANAAIIAPGTGLGEAGLYFDEKLYHPFATEGGHSDFASRDKLDFELVSTPRKALFVMKQCVFLFFYWRMNPPTMY